MEQLYTPEAYFQRVEDLYVEAGLDTDRGIRKYWRRHRGSWLKTQMRNVVSGAVLLWRLTRRIPDEALRREYLRHGWRLWRRRPSPSLVLLYAVKCAMHYHQYTMTRRMATGQSPIYSTF